MRVRAQPEFCCMRNINPHATQLAYCLSIVKQAPHTRITLHLWDLRRGATRERITLVELKDQFED